MNLSLVEAFKKFGSKPSNRVRALSAMAADGAMVLNCSPEYFGHPEQGVLRYEDRLSREVIGTKCTALLGQHLTLARDAALPVRMVVTSVASQNPRNAGCHVRLDLVGKVVEFDGDHFIVDFTRREESGQVTAPVRRQKAVSRGMR